jgi:hypothetical protein
MADAVNPYVVDGPVLKHAHFFGRKECFDWIDERLVSSQDQRTLVLYGAQFIGKSSFVRQLSRHLRSWSLTLVIDCGSDGPEPSDMRYQAAEEIQDLLSAELQTEIPRFDSSDTPDGGQKALRTWFHKVGENLKGQRLLVVFDGLFIRKGEDEENLALLVTEWRNATREEPWLEAIFVLDTEGWHPDDMPDPIFADADVREMQILDRDEASRLITEPVRGQMRFENRAVKRILDLSSGHPYFTQLLCHVIYDKCVDSRYVSVDDVEDALADTLAMGEDVLRSFWNRSSQDEQNILLVLSMVKGVRGIITLPEVLYALGTRRVKLSTQKASDILDNLVRRRILRKLGASSYRFGVDLFRLWIVRETERSAPQSQDRHRAIQSVSVPSQRRLKILRALLITVLVGVVGAVLLALGYWIWGAFGMDGKTAQNRPQETPEPPTTRLSSSWVGIEEPTLTALMPTATYKAVLAHIKPVMAYMYKEKEEDAWDIYIMEIGGEPEALTQDPADESFPAWAPDGENLAFVSNRDGNREIYRIRPDGTEMINLTSHSDEDWTPAWSPDGQEIAFASMRDGNWEIYVMNSDGSFQTRLTHDEASDFSPAWSPDGNKIAFVSNRDENWEVYVMNRDGSAQIRLTDNEATDISPAWTPDGSRIAFESYRDGDMEIYLMNPDGSGKMNLTNDVGADDHGPSWAPDGASLLYYSNRDGGWDLFRITAQGTNIENLTRSESLEQSPVFKPR